MGISIINMDKSHLEEASIIFYKAFNAVGQKWTLEFTKKRIEQYFNTDTCWIALEGTKVVGILTSKIDYVVDHQELYIDIIAVLPEFNNKGIGNSLMQQATEYAISNNFPCLWLTANPSIYSYKWYINSGFRESSWKNLTKDLTV